jgi:superfamily II DNA or RNA helicase
VSESGLVSKASVLVDFLGDAIAARLLVEAERLSYGFQTNGTFATETSLIEPLPHQYLAVYEHMLPQARLRFLLTDDAGAGKTIMSGLYIREMLARRRIRRILIVPPAGLVGNWERELRMLFGLEFAIISSAEARSRNPFVGAESDQLIMSVDTLAGDRAFARLQESTVEPYDLVIFDEAHKLSATQLPDFTITKTDRYRLAEAIAGAEVDEPRWVLGWSAQHLVLLTATPHMGKEIPYYFLWRLLEPDALASREAFAHFPNEARARRFLRRTKEEMVWYNGRPIFPKRESITLSFTLTPGDAGEQQLYDETTRYIDDYYNRASQLNRSAARLAKSVFQRRLASSTAALLCSFERRLKKIIDTITGIESGKLKPADLESGARRAGSGTIDLFDNRTADEEDARDGREENELADDDAVTSLIAGKLADLELERDQLVHLVASAKAVIAAGPGSKFLRLREFLKEDGGDGEKLLIFTEHRDTLNFLFRELEQIGFAGRVAHIHGGMPFRERDDQVELFRKAADAGGATILAATDAAGEGLNMQFCWRMVNYDIPWNPARLEQRMGRIHRFGQVHDPVVIVNMIASNTREGRVMATLLAKLDTIRKDLGSDKVFDVIGRLFEDISLARFFEELSDDDVAGLAMQTIEKNLTSERVREIEQADRDRYGSGDVASQLPRLREELERAKLTRLLPGSVEAIVRGALPLLGLAIDGDLESGFRFAEEAPFALEPLRPALERYGDASRTSFTLRRPAAGSELVFLRPGEPVFERLGALIEHRFSEDALRGAVYVDPTATGPYILHVARISVVRGRDTLASDLVAVKQTSVDALEPWPAGFLALLMPGRGDFDEFSGAAESAQALVASAHVFLRERVARSRVDELAARLRDDLPERERTINAGFAYQESELAEARKRWRAKVESGTPQANAELAAIKQRQRDLQHRRETAIGRVRSEPDSLAVGIVEFVAHAYVLPTNDPELKLRFDADVEATAVRIATEFEERLGAQVIDVSRPDRARAAGLEEYPGFDLLSRRVDGTERAIEVKGRASRGAVQMTLNELVKAASLGEQAWLYVVYECASVAPDLCRVRDPSNSLRHRLAGHAIIEQNEIVATSTLEI